MARHRWPPNDSLEHEICYSLLAGVYALLTIACSVRWFALYRSHKDVYDRAPTRPDRTYLLLFLTFLILCVACRTVHFFLHLDIVHHDDYALWCPRSTLNNLGDAFFFSQNIVVVMVWVRLIFGCYQIVQRFWIVQVAAASVCVGMALLFALGSVAKCTATSVLGLCVESPGNSCRDDPRTNLDWVIYIGWSTVCLTCGLLYCATGALLRFKLSRMTLYGQSSVIASKRSKRIAIIAALCTVSFVGRSIFLFIEQMLPTHLYENKHWPIISVAYFALSEVSPFVALLFLTARPVRPRQMTTGGSITASDSSYNRMGSV